ncbi:hypothetical protein F5888DRAFT_1753258 [Russula emetica]|nr:hypothetical protein F5888DRAFT_1753258 [Russula emetica]
MPPPSILPRSPPPGPVSSKKARLINKNIVSKPTGFIHFVHASDADQAEALLTRWGPEPLSAFANWATHAGLYPLRFESERQTRLAPLMRSLMRSSWVSSH